MSTEPVSNAEAAWQPRIVAFVCRWCTYAGADLAGTSRLKYPPQIRIVKLPCTGRIDPLFLLRAFQMGADGVLVSGCHPGDCHYTSGNYIARRRWTLFRELLDYVGLESERVHFSWVSAAEGGKFVDVVKKVTESIRSVGPFPGFEPADGALTTGIAKEARLDAAPGGRSDVETMKRDLASGGVRAVLGFWTGRRAGSMRPAWITDPAGLDRILVQPNSHPSLVTYLVRRLREEPEGVYGIAAGPKDREAIEILAAEEQIDRARIKVYEPDAASGAPRAAASEAGIVPGMDRPARERWTFWTGQFAQCLRCNACREGCPLCSCVRCIADKTRPRWIDSSSTPAGNWVWNVTRAFHLAGRCVDCGACTAACPVGIPLGALNQQMKRAAEKAFGPPGSEEKGRRSPLVTFRIEDEAPFIL